MFLQKKISPSDGQMAKVIRKWRHYKWRSLFLEVTFTSSSDEQMAKAIE